MKLFCDEVILKEWLFIGILIVPETIETNFLQALLNKRCGHPDNNKIWGKCDLACSYHTKNNTEIHYTEVDRSRDKFFIAEKWIDYLLNDTENIYFYILGIDLEKLNQSFFGDKKQQHNIYNRFFKTAILKSVKSYFYKYQQIIISEIYHDSSTALETHAYFSWHSIFKIGSRDSKVKFTAKDIEFIDSDHRKSLNSYSNFIQFIDLLLGCTHNCLEYGSKNEDKEKLSMQSLPLIERLVKTPNNVNSKYKYVGRQKIEFFPMYDISNLDEKSLEYQRKRMKAFYSDRKIKIKSKDQPILPF